MAWRSCLLKLSDGVDCQMAWWSSLLKLSDGTACRSCLAEQSAELYAGARNQERRLGTRPARGGQWPAGVRWDRPGVDSGLPWCAWAGLDGIGGICQYWSQDFICRSSRDMEQKALMKAVARRVLVKSGTL